MIESIRSLVRPFISVTLVSTLIILALIGKIEAKEVLTPISMVIAFHFGERAAIKKD